MSEPDSKETCDKNLVAEVSRRDGDASHGIVGKKQGLGKRKARKRKAEEIIVDSEAGTGHDDSGETTNKANNSRSAFAKRSRLRGKLADMMKMPIDIFSEIAHHLSPADLLQLARSTKWFRQMLMSKQAASIWQAAERAVGLPKCPPHMSSPQLARFLFDILCMNIQGCHKERAQNMLFMYGIRLCKACKQEKIRQGSNISIERHVKFGDDLNIEVFMLIPMIPSPTTRQRLQQQQQPQTNSVSDEVADEEEVEDAPEDESKDKSGLFLKRMMKLARTYSFSLRNDSYYTPFLYEALKEYTDLRDSRSEQMAFVKKKILAVKRIVASSKTIEDWVLEQQKARKRMKDEREDLVLQKLKEEGYTSDDLSRSFDEQSCKWTSLVRKDDPLTDRVWTTLKPKLEEIIQARREQRNIYERDKRIEEKTRFLRNLICKSIGKEMYVDISKALESPWIKELILRDDANYNFTDDDLNSVEEKMNAQNIKEKKRVLKETAKKLIQARYDYNLKMVPENLEGSSAEDIALDTLFHPSAMTSTGGCFPRLISYFEAFSRMWRANSGVPVYSYEPGPIEPASKEVMIIADTLQRSIIPDVKSVPDLKGNFICIRCPPPIRRMMNWEKLINHFVRENEVYRKRQEAKIATEDDDVKKIVNNNVHDTTSVQTLAIRTDAEFHDEVKEVKLCGCWDATHRHYMLRRRQRWNEPIECYLCRQLANNPRGFLCIEELKAHKLAYHTEVEALTPKEQQTDYHFNKMSFLEFLIGEGTDDEEPAHL